jgi:hypothetical protein
LESELILANDLLSTHFAWNSYTAVYSSLCTQTNLRVTYSGQTGGWSESTLILTNQSQSKITRLIRVDQSQASKLVTEDRRTEKVTYRALGSRQSQKCNLKH